MNKICYNSKKGYMEKLNDNSDLIRYLENGFLTQSFLDDKFVKEKVYCDYNHKNRKEKILLF